jgi:[ribosomal protein S5]-alanine N-acetyltransferase
MAQRPTIYTDRLTLRPFEMSDAPAVAAICADKDIAANTLFVPHPYALTDAESWLQKHQESFDSGRDVQFAITLTPTKELIGAMGLVIERAHDRAELGYWIARPHWSRGYASEAARAAIRYGFETAGLNRINAYHYIRNPASGRVLQNAGLRYEGLLRQHIKKWGQYEDCAFYALIRADYHAQRR